MELFVIVELDLLVHHLFRSRGIDIICTLYAYELNDKKNRYSRIKFIVRHAD